MKTLQSLLSACCFFFAFNLVQAERYPTAGFFLPDSVSEMTLNYRMIKGLIVLPVTINDSVKVNLILDTGCRNLILFGKRFQKRLPTHAGKQIEFSGLGSGRPITGDLSTGNKVSINQVLGNGIPIVIVGNNNLFGMYHNVDGVIGYDIFVKFEVEIDASRRTIAFRPALSSITPQGFTHVPLQIVDARPVMTSDLFMNRKTSRRIELMIDTGSSLALLLKTTNIEEFDHYRHEAVLGIGFNGPVSGYQTTSHRLQLHNMEINDVPTGIVSSPWHNNASIGMEILKEYIFILNYCKAFACFKKLETNA